MEIGDSRSWIFYYLICFVALLWVGFLFTQDTMLWVGLLLVLVVLGFSIILFVMLLIELSKERAKKRESDS
ncbi:peptidoglycan/LPS O-acetylase OafA/YrhL [Methanolinea mesophila]|uniref:hypothetical protein n=1 Tax=Methanolinea mesophila TaxID=547055 RepID=UPI001AE27101|nr:hypothetical protein [Methanolinea mesophila]MBP1928024.1 peptidoglycan/LPS O-acetylase OafA/YrhL [Methanolinea mesophila]